MGFVTNVPKWSTLNDKKKKKKGKKGPFRGGTETNRNALPISAVVGKVNFAMNLGRIFDLIPLYHTHSTNTLYSKGIDNESF